MLVLLLLALVGSCWGLQPGLEYQYRYNGRVAAGIRSIKDQISGAGIHADVTVQMTKQFVILVQIANVEVGDFHGVLKCDSRAPLPIEYHAMEEGAVLLTKPFVVHLNSTEDLDYYEVPEEPAWVTNVRRSIVNIFRAAPLRVNFGSIDLDIKIPMPSALETTIVGRCRNWYSVMRLPNIDADRENHEREAVVEDDIQRDALSDSLTDPGSGTKSGRKGSTKTRKGTKAKHGKTSPPARILDIPAISDSLWTMSRTVDFDSCEDLVAMKLHGHKNTDEKIARASVGTYLLRGNYEGWRIERAVVEGSVSVFADKYGKRHVDTFTNQTLELRAVRILHDLLPVDYETHLGRTWHYQVDHQLPDTMRDLGTRPIIEQITTGVPVSDNLGTDARSVILDGIQAIATHLTTTPHPTTSLSEKIGKIADATALLSREDIDALEDILHTIETPLLKINIFHQALISAGTGPSISFLLDKMMDAEYRHSHSGSLQRLLEDIHTTVKNPLLISKLMELVGTMTWEGEDEYMKAIGLMNLAKLANELCLNAEKRETFGINTCDPEHTCNPDMILQNFLPTLVAGLQDGEEPMWRRVVYIQALINLGTPQTIHTLKNIILGVTESHISVRVNAILGLSSVYMPKTAMNTVFQILMPIFENLGEHYEVRSMAFLAMSSWAPNTSWWQSVAVSTWREPSSQVANFISTSLKTLSRGREPLSKSASRVVHLAKPAAPSSITHSSLTFLYEYVYNCELQSAMAFAWLASTQSFFPTSVLLRLQDNTITGYTVEQTIAIHQDILDDVWRILTHQTGGHPVSTTDAAFSIVSDMFEQVKEQLGVVPKTKEAEFSLWIKFQKVVLSIRAIILAGRNGPIELDPLLYTNLFASQLDTPIFHRTVDSNIALPTDLGLPFLIKYSEQQAAWYDIHVTAQSAGLPKLKKSLVVTYDTSHDSTLEVKTLLPWSQKFAVGAGLHNVLSLLVPLNLHVTLDINHKTLQFTVAPGTTDPVELVSSHNHPYTVLTGPFPTDLHTDHHDYRTIKIADTELYSRHTHPLPTVMGLEVETIWSADFAFPMDFNILLTPSYKIWDYSIVLHPESSATKSIAVTIFYETLQRSAKIQEPDEYIGQETQGTQKVDLFADYSQMSQTQSGGFQEIDDIETIGVEQTSQSRALIAKLQQEFLPASGGSVNTLSARVELQGVPTRSYEAVLTWIVGTTHARPEEGVEQTLFRKAQFTFLQNVPEGTLGEAHVTCLKVQELGPFFLPMASVEDVLGTKFATGLEVDLFDGVSCEQSPVLKIRGSATVSEAELSRIHGLLTPEGSDCHGEPTLHPSDIIATPIYDHAHFNITWTQEYPEVLQNMTYYLDDLLRASYFSHMSQDHTVRNPDNCIEIDASKNPTTNLWTIRTTMPHDVSVIHDVLLTSPLESSHTSQFPRIFDTSQITQTKPSVCVIEDTKVTTFDGQVLPLEPSNCWTAADMYVADESEGVDPAVGIFQVRYTGEWEFRCLWPSKGLLMDMTRSHLLVNGVEYDGKDERFHIHHVSGGILLVFNTGTAVKLTDKVEIMETAVFRSKLIGLCGNMDGERSFEMVGPLGCIYTDPALYALAWATSGDDCNAFTLRTKKAKLVEFQQTCNKRTYVPTGISHENAIYECEAWVYQQQEFGDYRCTALTPTPVCNPQSREIYPITLPIEYDCEVVSHYYQQQEGVPKKCYSHTLPTTYPAGCVPFMQYYGGHKEVAS